VTHAETPAPADHEAVRNELQERINTLGKDYGRLQREAEKAQKELDRATRQMQEVRTLLEQYGSTMSVLSDLAELGPGDRQDTVYQTGGQPLGPIPHGGKGRVLYSRFDRSERLMIISDDFTLPKFTEREAATPFLRHGHTEWVNNPAVTWTSR
jgi:predicted nuclease with TOPRIM domain